MGVTASPPARSRIGPGNDATGGEGVRWLPRRVQSVSVLRRFALASIVANVLVVVTGGAVRLTGSGLGCPTWPRCTTGSLTPTHELAGHGVIEFSNRMIGVAVAIVAVLTWLIAMALRRERVLATLAAAAVPLQGVLGGLLVLTDLNPWLVALHFLFSMALLAVTFLLWTRLRTDRERAAVPTVALGLTRVTAAVTAVVLAIGTVVTGSGPHAGAAQHGTVHRTGLNVASMAQLHADVVMVLVGLSVGLVALMYVLRVPDRVRRAALILLGVELAQGVIGYTQYFLDVPPLLVAFHMLGACLVWLAAVHMLLSVRREAVPA